MIPGTWVLHLPIIAIVPGLLLTHRLIRRGPGSGGARTRPAGDSHGDGHRDNGRRRSPPDRTYQSSGALRLAPDGLSVCAAQACGLARAGALLP